MCHFCWRHHYIVSAGTKSPNPSHVNISLTFFPQINLLQRRASTLTTCSPSPEGFDWLSLSGLDKDSQTTGAQLTLRELGRRRPAYIETARESWCWAPCWLRYNNSLQRTAWLVPPQPWVRGWGGGRVKHLFWWAEELRIKRDGADCGWGPRRSEGWRHGGQKTRRQLEEFRRGGKVAAAAFQIL